MPIILLIRHGENEYSRTGRMPGRLPGIHLNELGRVQAQVLAEKLTGKHIKAIYSSPLARALDTAEPIANALGLTVIPHDGLIETDPGEWTGKTIKSLRHRKLWNTVQKSPSTFCFPGGESFLEAQLRIVFEIENLCSQYDSKDFVIGVSHADPIRLAVAYFIGLPLDRLQRLHVSTASITAIRINGQDQQLLTLNYDPSFSLVE
jgi:broad specificity phosphatase PhoE